MVNPLAIGSSVAAFLTSIYYFTSKDSFLFPFSNFDDGSVSQHGFSSSSSSSLTSHLYDIFDPSISLLTTFTNENITNLKYQPSDNEIFQNEWLHEEMNWLIHVYVPWFRPCHKLADEWEIYAKKFYVSGTKIKLAKINAQLYPELAAILNIRWYPSIIHVHRHQALNHLELRSFSRHHARDFDTLKLWVTQNWTNVKPYKFLPLEESESFDDHWHPDFLYLIQLIFFNFMMQWIIAWNEFLFIMVKENPTFLYSTFLTIFLILLLIVYRLPKWIHRWKN